MSRQIKIEEGMQLVCTAPFLAKVWCINGLNDKVNITPNGEVFTVAHVCGQFLGLASERNRITVDAREVQLELAQ